MAAALARWQAANAVGDRPAGERARRELAALGLLAVRLGEAPPPGTGPLPPPIRQRLNVLVHELGGTLEAPPPDAETTPDPAPLAFAARVTRRLAEMPVFDRAGVAFAGTDADRRASQQTAEVAGLRIVRRMADRTTVEVVVTAGRETNGNDLVALSVRAGTDPGTLFLLPLWRYSTEEPFVATARIRLRSARISMAVIPPFPARRLTGDDAAAIARSIAVTTNSGRDAWRRIAAARLPDDPVRTAVLEATRT
ncbi:hypothetical protein BCD49_30295 [Pseudofrankia sp. EUN1h]|nr:hypothetical protein BCD49_30295 [Pseudofrankia sp. EUN1h]